MTVFVLFVSMQPCTAANVMDSSAFIWLQNGEQFYETDGSATQIVYIKGSGSMNSADLRELRAFYCDERSTSEKQYYPIPIEQKDGNYSLRVTTPTRARYLIHVAAKHHEEQLMAQIAVYLYGRGETKKRSKSILQPQDITFPSLELRSSGNSMRPQTGQTLKLTYKSVHPQAGALKEMNVIDLKNKSIENLLPDADGVFVMIPPHDPQLNRSGNAAYKEMIVYVKETAGEKVYKTSMNILLRRSSAAFRNLQHGFFLFFVTLIAVLAMVLYRRRSMPY
jgi:hypothetical protein